MVKKPVLKQTIVFNKHFRKQVFSSLLFKQIFKDWSISYKSVVFRPPNFLILDMIFR